MSSQAGWYPDPGGQPGMFRYWDGSAWSPQLSPNPAGPLPGAPSGSTQQFGADPRAPITPGGPGLGQAPGGPGPSFGPSAGYAQGAAGSPGIGGQPRPGYGYVGATQPGATPPGGTPPPYPIQQPRRGAGFWVLAGGIILICVIAIPAAIQTLPGLLGFRETDPGLEPGGGPTQSICPPEPDDQPTDMAAEIRGGRLYAGNMSYPVLGSPWSPPYYDRRVPFGRDTQVQAVTVETDYDGRGNGWVASVLLAELAAGDGFFTPEDGARVVVECVVGRFYGDDTDVGRDDRVWEAIEIDGREGWLVESQLSFDIPGLRTKGELLIVVIVRTSDTKSALYYASIPDTVPELVEPARNLIQELRVED